MKNLVKHIGFKNSPEIESIFIENETNLSKIVEYLYSGNILIAAPNNNIYTDGIWVWPEFFIDKLKTEAVAPKDFLLRIKKNDFVCPKVSDDVYNLILKSIVSVVDNLGRNRW